MKDNKNLLKRFVSSKRIKVVELHDSQLNSDYTKITDNDYANITQGIRVEKASIENDISLFINQDGNVYKRYSIDIFIKHRDKPICIYFDELDEAIKAYNAIYGDIVQERPVEFEPYLENISWGDENF